MVLYNGSSYFLFTERSLFLSVEVIKYSDTKPFINPNTNQELWDLYILMADFHSQFRIFIVFPIGF